MIRYVYSVVRFVPDPARGEFVNVGAVVGSDDTSEWDVRQVNSLRRAKAIDDSRCLSAVSSVIEDLTGTIADYADALELAVSTEGLDEPSEDWLRSLNGFYQHVVQISPPASVVCNTLEDAFKLVFDEVLVDEASSRKPYVRRTVASNQLKLAYKAQNLVRNTQFFERVHIASGRFEETLDFAVVGKSILQLAQAWSFSLPDQSDISQRIRAWAWTMGHLHENGGEVSYQNQSFRVHKGDIPALEVVYVPPNTDYGNEAFDEAQAVFKEINATMSPMSEVNEVAARAQLALAN